MTADPPTPPAVLEERARITKIIESLADSWQLFICTHSEDAEIAVWTLIAELDLIRSQIDDSIPTEEI